MARFRTAIDEIFSTSPFSALLTPCLSGRNRASNVVQGGCDDSHYFIWYVARTRNSKFYMFSCGSREYASECLPRLVGLKRSLQTLPNQPRIFTVKQRSKRLLQLCSLYLVRDAHCTRPCTKPNPLEPGDFFAEEERILPEPVSPYRSRRRRRRDRTRRIWDVPRRHSARKIAESVKEGATARSRNGKVDIGKAYLEVGIVAAENT